jgi:hypothetical protein
MYLQNRWAVHPTTSKSKHSKNQSMNSSMISAPTGGPSKDYDKATFKVASIQKKSKQEKQTTDAERKQHLAKNFKFNHGHKSSKADREDISDKLLSHKTDHFSKIPEYDMEFMTEETLEALFKFL